jgi:outer membrane protein assembly factor BamB
MKLSNETRRRIAVPLSAALALALTGCGVLGGGDKPKTPTVGNRVPILSRVESGARVDPALASLAVVLPPPAPSPDWPQAGGTASKVYGHPELGANPQRLWTATISGSNQQRRLAAAPVIGGGKLFAFDTEGMLRAYDAATGAPAWRTSFSIDGDGASSVFGGGASFFDNKVFVTTGFGEVAALDANTGSQLWKVKPAGPLRGSPTIAFNALFVMTQDNQIISLNLTDGAVLWNQTASVGQSGVFGVAAPAAGQGSVISGFSTGELIAYRYENGRQLWSDALARTSIATQVGVLTDIDADPIIDRGRVFALGQGGRMAAYDLLSGQRIWELNVAGISTPAVAGDWIFALSDDAKLLCISRANGKVRWLTQLARYEDEEDRKGAIFWTGPVLAGNRLWIANSRGETYAANVEDGTVAPFVKLDESVSLSPVVAGGVLYFLDDSGKITAFR